MSDNSFGNSSWSAVLVLEFTQISNVQPISELKTNMLDWLFAKLISSFNGDDES